MNARIISACRHLRALRDGWRTSNARTHGCIHEPHGQSILALTSPGTYMNPENHGEITGFTPVDASFAGGEYYMNRRTQVPSIGFPYADNIACNASNRVPSYAHHDASPSAVAPICFFGRIVGIRIRLRPIAIQKRLAGGAVRKPRDNRGCRQCQRY